MSLSVERLTPDGAGAVAVIRVRGARAHDALRSLVGEGTRADAGPRLVHLAIDGETLDEALVCALAEDEIEIHVHGSPPLVERILLHLRAFEPAHAPSRAPTLEERAAASLARAPCEAAARILLDQSEGALRRELSALCELDEASLRASVETLLARARVARFVLAPADVVIAGPVNAGKSTLFNVLLGERRAIVSAEPGTTRDLIRESALLGAYPVRLADTAGDRDTAGDLDTGASEIEHAGQARGREARGAADLVLWLESAERDDVARPPALASKIAVVRTFADRLAPVRADRLQFGRRTGTEQAISATNDPEGARAFVEAAFQRAFDLPADPWTPGAGVPFTPEVVAALEGCRAAGGDRAIALAAVASAASLP